MRDFPLHPADKPLSPGNLSAKVAHGKLEVPRAVAEAAREQDIRTGIQLLSYARAFPGALAFSLGWTPEQVVTAVGHLARQLGQDAPPERRRRVSFGARNPSEI